MATNTAFGTLASPTTQLFGGNAGGGVAGPAPEKKKLAAQQGLAPGTSPTFAQLQQQGQARPAPAAGMAPAPALQQPPMLSALNAQLSQPTPQQPAQPRQASAQTQFTNQQYKEAERARRTAQESGVSYLREQAATLPEGIRRQALQVLESVEAGGNSGGGTSSQQFGSISQGYDPDTGMPYMDYAPPGGTSQRIGMAAPQPYLDVLGTLNSEGYNQYAQKNVPAPVVLEDDGSTPISRPPFIFEDEGGGQAQQDEQMAYASNTAPQQGLPAYQSSGQFGGSSQAQALRARLEQQLNNLSQNEAQIQGQSYAALRKAKMDEMGAEFGAQRSQLEEDLARRGLAASTIGGGRYGDLAGQQARATASFEADLLKQQAEAEAENRKVYLSGMSELAGMAGQQDLGAFEANLKSRQADADISLRTQELQQEGALRGRELTLQEARDLATKEYQGGQLQQGYAEISSRERMSASDIASRQQMQQSQFGFDREQSALERNLRETMQTRELTSEEKRQLTQIEANKASQLSEQTFQGGQSKLERDLRETMQSRELTAAEARQLAGINADKAAALLRNTFEKGESALSRTFQSEQSQLDRDLRTTLSDKDITAATERFNKQLGLDERRFGADQDAAKNQFLSTLAQTLAPLDANKRAQILADLGIKPKPGGGYSTTDGENTDF